MTTDAPRFECTLQVRGYELDGFAHVNHAAYLNYFEHARYLALDHGGFPLPALLERGWGIHVVRIEVDYRRELVLGDSIHVTTWVDHWRASSMTLRQVAVRQRDGEVAAEASVVAVWIGQDGRPMRIPDEARRALAEGRSG
jgi:YbgC/YbaW family acyl-CoA thioester hydrolase